LVQQTEYHFFALFLMINSTAVKVAVLSHLKAIITVLITVNCGEDRFIFYKRMVECFL